MTDPAQLAKQCRADADQAVTGDRPLVATIASLERRLREAAGMIEQLDAITRKLADLTPPDCRGHDSTAEAMACQCPTVGQRMLNREGAPAVARVVAEEETR